MNILLQDLGHAGATVMQAALNAMPTSARTTVADACAAGAKLELRMREGDPSLVALWLVQPDGRDLVEVTRVV